VHRYGLYAGRGEYDLVQWVDGTSGAPVVPDRGGLPGLDRYAKVVVDGRERLAGYVEASRGCRFRCRHCPVPVVYDGRMRIVDADLVLADIAQLVAAGAEHITFGDPDFLNGPHHSLRIVRALHERWPDLTFDVTTKVELILRHPEVWSELAAAGCLFVVSAVECVDDAVLARLDKGHTATDAARAVHLLRSHGIELRPSLLPFTPWTTHQSLIDLLDFVTVNDLVGNVEPVHWSIRLLIPEGSLLTGIVDPDWTSPLDDLQRSVAAVVETTPDPAEAFLAVAALVAPGRWHEVTARDTPRLSEPWFCCAEPTSLQVSRITG
jgi:hypothetical protein